MRWILIAALWLAFEIGSAGLVTKVYSDQVNSLLGSVLTALDKR